MVVGSSPIRFSENERGEIVKILIQEEWYDALEPVYRYFKSISDLVDITASPLSPSIGLATELINQIIVEFEVAGWGFAIGLLAALKWAAEHAVTFGKFTYEMTGKVGRSKVGMFEPGGGIVVHELSADE